MTYFGISTERYGGWGKEEKGEALEYAEIAPERELREDSDDND